MTISGTSKNYSSSYAPMSRGMGRWLARFDTQIGRLRALCLIAALSLFGFLFWSAYAKAPVSDEFGHMYAGLAYLESGDTKLFNVNPPLVRSLGALPAFVGGIRTNLAERLSRPVPYSRAEFLSGRQLFRHDPVAFQESLFLGRLVVGTFCVLGYFLLVALGKQLGGMLCGLLSGLLWAFQPQVIAHGALITSDVACAVLMLASVWQLQRVASKLTWGSVTALGLVWGLAMLTKFTALALLPVVVLVLSYHAANPACYRSLLAPVLLSIVVACTLAIPFRFEGWGMPLRDYNFLSPTFCKFQKDLAWLGGAVRVPLPDQFLLGIDRQQLDFDRGLPSFAAGERALHGWWWFYLYSMWVKMPLGTLASIPIAGMPLLFRWKTFGAGLEIPLLALASVLLITAMQNGFAQQHRYILVAYPFLFLVIGTMGGRVITSNERLLGVPLKRFGQAIVICIAFTLVGFFSAAPHWMSAFNSLAGGNQTGYMCLFNDASDWGQDTYRIRDWINAHQTTKPIFVQSSISGYSEIRAVGAMEFQELPGHQIAVLPRPCWVVVSRTDLAYHAGLAIELEDCPVKETIGGTHDVYRLTESLVPTQVAAPHSNGDLK